MGEPIQLRNTHRIVRINDGDQAHPSQIERLLQPLYMAVDPVVDLSGLKSVGEALLAQISHLNRYHTSKGGDRIRVVADHPHVKRGLGDGKACAFRLYDSLEEALTAAT